ncbi:MAG: transporter substrate-binding domain-containing protein [Alphaproteobacteria bacterium]|nr:transporter substrate-binding domain-containing protein [Alphaproteobacteria bacterium]
MKKLNYLIALMGIFISFSASAKLDEDFGDFKNQKVGVMMGSSNAGIVQDKIPSAQIVYYKTNDEMIQALKAGVIKAIAQERPISEKIVAENEGLEIYEKPVEEISYGSAVNGHDQELLDEINAVHDKLVENGTFKKYQDLWLGKDYDSIEMPSIPRSEKRNLIVGYAPEGYPFSYKTNEGAVRGFSVHLLYLILNELGYGVADLVPYDYDNLFKALNYRQVDIVVGDLTITKERMQFYKFEHPVYSSECVFIVVKTQKAEKKGFFDKIKGLVSHSK